MPGTKAIFAMLALTPPLFAAETHDPCTAAPTAPAVRFTLAVKDHSAVFQYGEIIPLALSFTSEVENRYHADVRTYDRSGRLGIEAWCVQPEAPDPIEAYFAFGVIGGGIGSERVLDNKPLMAEAELNEWRTLAPGHYRVFAVSSRVWRPPDPEEQTPYGRISEVVRSNAIEIDIATPEPGWQAHQLQIAVQALAANRPSEDARHAARVLRFLNSRDSTVELARQFTGMNQPLAWELMAGLYGSPHRQLAIESMRAELVAPDHGITPLFISTLVRLQVAADPNWRAPTYDPSNPEKAKAYWETRRAHELELTKAELRSAVRALPLKRGPARALTLHAILATGAVDEKLVQAVRPALIDAWSDLPQDAQRELIEGRWPMIAGPEMLPILRRMAANPPAPNAAAFPISRESIVKHIFELDPEAAREIIRADLENGSPTLPLVKLLPAEDLTKALPAALDRIKTAMAREIDYLLVDHYAPESALEIVRAAFEKHPGAWACVQQSAMLRYFLRVAPEYGSSAVNGAMDARKNTGCYRMLLPELGDKLPAVEKRAIQALADPDAEVAISALQTLQKWGSPDAEKALWDLLESPGANAAKLEYWLVLAIGQGRSWMCPPEKLARLSRLVRSRTQRPQIESWISQWKEQPAVIRPIFYTDRDPTFSVVQYDQLTEEQLVSKLAQFPRGTEFQWSFWPVEQAIPTVSLAKQEALYERVRAAAERSGAWIAKTPAK
jgi:hypothetical protein